MTMHGFTGAERIAIERARQLLPKEAGGEGWDAAHDQSHGSELALAAACYALPDTERDLETYIRNRTRSILSELWPWAWHWWKPSVTNHASLVHQTKADRIRDLEKAGALCAAAIDAIQNG